jgi:MFS family permease
MQIHLIFGFVIGYIFNFIIDLFEVSQESWKYHLLEKLSIEGLFVKDNLTFALSLVFIIGTVLGLYGLKLLGKQQERKIRVVREKEAFSLFEPLKNKDFRRLLRFGLWWMFAIGVGSPFWGPFILKDLKMSLVEFQMYNMLGTIGLLLSMRLWGKFIDKFGNKTAMKVCVLLGSINPTVWLFVNENSYSLLWLEGFTSGVMWGGANLITFNFVLAIAPRGKEQHWSAVYSSLCGCMMLLTIMLSGLLYPKSSLVLGSFVLLPAQILFGLTALLRLTAEIPLYFVNEPKAVPLRKTVGYASEYVLAKLIRFKDTVFKVLNI